MSGSVVEHVRLHKTRPDFGFASVRLTGVFLYGIRVSEVDGELFIEQPTQIGKTGKLWPVFKLQPGTRELVEAEIARLWAMPT